MSNRATHTRNRIFAVLLAAWGAVLLAPVAESADRPLRRNVYGSPVEDAAGRHLSYSRPQIERQALETTALRSAATNDAPGTPSAIAAREAAAQASGQLFLPVLGYAAFGSGIGFSGIVVDDASGRTEVYLGGSTTTFGSGNYWYSLAYQADTGEYVQTHVSPYYQAGIRRIKVADVVGDALREIVVALDDGRILIQKASSKLPIAQIITPAGLRGLDIADLDGDGHNELVVSTADHLFVYAGDGTLEWDLANAGGEDVRVGQFDADPALEIAVTSGQIVDAVTHAVQWSWPAGFGVKLEAADIDGDGMQELIAAEQWSFVWAYDVDRKLPKWSISTPQDIGAIRLANVDSDPALELLVGDGQWGQVRAYDTVTRLVDGTIANPEHGVTNITFADVNGDGVSEVLWGAGATSTGPDHLYVADWSTHTIAWQSLDLVGPFLGPLRGDLDGDGRAEIVLASSESDSGYAGGRILVFDDLFRLRGVSSPVGGNLSLTGIHDLQLADVDADGKPEILVAADRLYDGLIEVYDYDAGFHLSWTNASLPVGAPFHSVAAADVDNDGTVEIVGGGGREHTGAAGVFVYVYDYATASEEWHSLQMGSFWDAVSGLTLADVNRDGVREIVGMVKGGDLYVFDGGSKELQAILPGQFTTVQTLDGPGGPLLMLGDQNGQLVFAGYFGGDYRVLSRTRVAADPIDGLTLGSDRTALWVGSGGRLRLLTSAGVVWTSPSYGQVFGVHADFWPGQPLVLSAGSYGLVGFWVIPF
jgi:hypothetical protein